ncbi:MAG: hypothetical protein JSW00_08515 [Thermoplasmata archaeon]|nr:MAG: hypothetical protein JSW00_08515 [Thermoplasmata archaeon]
MRKVKTFGIMLGTLLIATILFSGSAVAAWYYAGSVYSAVDCENPEEALGAPDSSYATVGTNEPTPATGDLWLDMGFTGIPDNQLFTVFGTNGWGLKEEYTVEVYRDDFLASCGPWNNNWDTVDNNFTTGTSGSGHVWRYVKIDGEDGQTDATDTIYGPEIDAVGYEYP